MQNPPTHEELTEQAKILRDLYFFHLNSIKNDDIGKQYAISKAISEFEFNHRHKLWYKCDFMFDVQNRMVFFKSRHSAMVGVSLYQGFDFN